MRTMFRSLGVVNYRTWFIGALVSNVGFWMQRTAQDWIVLTELTDHDAVAVGITTALQMAPVVLLVPLSGYISDRFDRRTVLTMTNTAMGLLAVLLGTLVITGTIQLWHIYLIAGIGGVVNAIENPSKQGFVSELVTAERLTNAVSLNSASFNVARTAGPSIAAGLVFFVGAGWVFYINAVTFIAMIVAIRMLDRSELIDTPRLARWKGNLSSGLRYVRTRPDLLVQFAAAFLIGAFVMNFPIFAATMTTVEFGLGVGQYGFLLSCLAVGAVIGALLAARRERPKLSVIAIGAAAAGATLGLAALMPVLLGLRGDPRADRGRGADDHGDLERVRAADHRTGHARAGDRDLLRDLPGRHPDRRSDRRLGRQHASARGPRSASPPSRHSWSASLARRLRPAQARRRPAVLAPAVTRGCRGRARARPGGRAPHLNGQRRSNTRRVELAVTSTRPSESVRTPSAKPARRPTFSAVPVARTTPVSRRTGAMNDILNSRVV